MRLYRLTMADLVSALACGTRIGQDGDGNPLVEGRVRAQRIRIVIARDDPAVVITVFARRR